MVKGAGVSGVSPSVVGMTAATTVTMSTATSVMMMAPGVGVMVAVAWMAGGIGSGVAFPVRLVTAHGAMAVDRTSNATVAAVTRALQCWSTRPMPRWMPPGRPLGSPPRSAAFCPRCSRPPGVHLVAAARCVAAPRVLLAVAPWLRGRRRRHRRHPLRRHRSFLPPPPRTSLLAQSRSGYRLTTLRRTSCSLHRVPHLSVRPGPRPALHRQSALPRLPCLSSGLWALEHGC